MKKVMIVLMFLMLAGGALAMDDPIKVKALPGDEIKLYVWPADGGQLLNLGKGLVDSEGIFETTFFSLNVPNVRYQIMVIRGGSKVIDEKNLANYGIMNPLFFDCTGTECRAVEEEIEVVEEINETNETVVAGNETVVVVENETKTHSDISDVYLTGKTMFTKEDGTINWGYSIGGGAIFLLFVVFAFMTFRGGKKKNHEVLEEDEKELEYMEKKVKETAKKIEKVKGKKERKKKIEAAKKKLAEEEEELRELEREPSEEKGEQKEKVEKQKGKVEEQEEKVEEEEEKVEEEEEKVEEQEEKEEKEKEKIKEAKIQNSSDEKTEI